MESAKDRPSQWATHDRTVTGDFRCGYKPVTKKLQSDYKCENFFNKFAVYPLIFENNMVYYKYGDRKSTKFCIIYQNSYKL